MSTSLGDMIVRIVGQNAEFDNAIDKSEKKYQSFQRTLEKGGKTLTKFVTLPLLALGTAAIKAAADMEMQEAAFTTLLGSAEKAKNLLAELKTFAAKTPFALGDLTRATQTLVGFGIETDKAVSVMKQIGDIAQGNKDKFGALTLAFAQASSTGRLMGQDLLQMINAGFNPLLQISNDTGVSIAELKKKMEKGEISVKMLEDAFRNATGEGGRFYKGMETASTTLTGKFSTLMDTVVETARSFGEVLLPTVKTIIDRATVLAEKFTNLSDGTKRFILIAGGIAAAIGPGMLVIAKMVMAFNVLKTAVIGATIAMKALDATTKTSIIGLAIAGVLVLTGVLITLKNRTKEAREEQENFNRALGEADFSIFGMRIAVLEREKTAIENNLKIYEANEKIIEEQLATKGIALGFTEKENKAYADQKARLAAVILELENLKRLQSTPPGSGGEGEGAPPPAALDLWTAHEQNIYEATKLRTERQIEAEKAVAAAEEALRQQDTDNFVANQQAQLDEAQRFDLANQLRLETEAELEAAVEAEITRMEQEEEAKRVKAAEDAAARKIAIESAWFSAVSNMVSALSDLTNAQYEAELQAAEGNDAEIRRIKRKQAQANKAFAIFDIGLKTAQAIVGFLANPSGTAGAALAIAAGVIGAIQAAAVLAAPLPQLARGGVIMPTPGGTPFIGGEGGVPEVVFPLDRLSEILAAVPSASADVGESMIHLQVNMDSAPILEQIFPATRNGRILIDARSVV